jgi:hypothetical protein
MTVPGISADCQARAFVMLAKLPEGFVYEQRRHIHQAD